MTTNGFVPRLGRVCLAGALAVLAACGGGGSSEPTFSAAPPGPPAAAAAGGNTSADAIEFTKAVVAAGDGMAAAKGSVSGLAALTGVTVSGAAAVPSFAPGPVGQKRALAVTTEPCDSLLDPPCSGTVRVDTDVADSAVVVRRGQYLDATFNAVSGFIHGQLITLAGGLRIEFLTDFNTNSSPLAGLALRLKPTAFSGTVAGFSFGPLNQTMDLTFDGQGVPSLTAAGARYGQLSGVTVNGVGSYQIQPGVARVGYGSPASGYVDVSLGSWRVDNGRPAANSVASASVSGWNVNVNVASSSTTTVVYGVSVAGAEPGSTRFWTVTAQYPPGGGAPSYTAAPAG